MEKKKKKKKKIPKTLKNLKTYIDYSQTIDDVYENLHYNLTKKRKILKVFADVIAVMESLIKN